MVLLNDFLVVSIESNCKRRRRLLSTDVLSVVFL